MGNILLLHICRVTLLHEVPKTSFKQHLKHRWLLPLAINVNVEKVTKVGYDKVKSREYSPIRVQM